MAISQNGEGLALGEDFSSLESEYESSHEQNHEDEQFLGDLFRAAGSALGLGESSHEFELGHEFAHEFENSHEFAHELAHEFEGSHEDEFAHEFGAHELSHEFAHEYEDEGEQFFKKIARAAKGFIKKAAPILGSIAKVAAPMVLTAVGGPVGGMLGKVATGLLGEGESELAHEFEGEAEADRQADREEEVHEVSAHEALGEYMAAIASQAQTEAEADAMAAAAAMTVISPADRVALRRVLPQMIRGITILTRILRRRRLSRPVVRLGPAIMRRSIRILKNQAGSGRPISSRAAARVMASQVSRTLRSPRRCALGIVKNARAVRSVTSPQRRRSGAF